MILICFLKTGRSPLPYPRTSCLLNSFKSRKYSQGVERNREWTQGDVREPKYFASWAALACKSGSVAQIAMPGLSVGPCQTEGGLGRCCGFGFLLWLNFWESLPPSRLCPAVNPFGRPALPNHTTLSLHSPLQPFPIFTPDAPNFSSENFKWNAKDSVDDQPLNKGVNELIGTSLTF